MANPTTNFGWVMPTSTSLVTNLPADFNTFGQGVDTTMAQLKGGSTGQVLSKTSATDMAFTWVTPSSLSSPLTTKGDLWTYTTTNARLAVGNNGETLVADSSTATGLRWQGSQAAGKNAVINGGMDIWQRGTSFSVGNGWTYTADRWQSTEGAGTWTLSRESSVVPSGSQYSLKLTSGGTTSGQIATLIETANVTQFQGKTVTISAQVAASTSIPMAISLYYSTTADDNISNTSTAISATTGGTATPTSTTFVTLTGTYAIPSTAKTLQVRINSTGNMTSTQAFYVGQVQLELGSVATAFTRTGGSIQGELAACQRYYYLHVTGASKCFGLANYFSSSLINAYVQFPVTMRTTPTLVVATGTDYYIISRNSADDAFNSFTIYQATTTGTGLQNGTEVSGTAGQSGILFTNPSQASIAFNGEL